MFNYSGMVKCGFDDDGIGTWKNDVHERPLDPPVRKYKSKKYNEVFILI